MVAIVVLNNFPGVKKRVSKLSNSVKIAAIQMNSNNVLEDNLLAASNEIERAASLGADMIVLPEFFCLLGGNQDERAEITEVHGSGYIQQWMSQKASYFNCWLIGGSIPVESADISRPFSRCYVFDSEGRCVSWYDKIHLFDVEVEDTIRSYRESNSFSAGNSVVVFDSPWGKMGLAICYDLRFPEQFRLLSERGALIIFIPSAFTALTGQAHWDTLLSARAIENQVFIVAPAQTGVHPNGRRTYGHSKIVEPWGSTLVSQTNGCGVVIESLDLVQQQKIRNQFPVLAHRRL